MTTTASLSNVLRKGGASAPPPWDQVDLGPLGPESASLQGLKPFLHRARRAAALKPRPSICHSSLRVGRGPMPAQDDSRWAWSRMTVICMVGLLGLGVAGAATPDECHALARHGRRAEAHACYQSLSATADQIGRAHV